MEDGQVFYRSKLEKQQDEAMARAPKLLQLGLGSIMIPSWDSFTGISSLLWCSLSSRWLSRLFKS